MATYNLASGYVDRVGDFGLLIGLRVSVVVATSHVAAQQGEMCFQHPYPMQ